MLHRRAGFLSAPIDGFHDDPRRTHSLWHLPKLPPATRPCATARAADGAEGRDPIGSRATRAGPISGGPVRRSLTGGLRRGGSGIPAARLADETPPYPPIDEYGTRISARNRLS